METQCMGCMEMYDYELETCPHCGFYFDASAEGDTDISVEAYLVPYSDGNYITEFHVYGNYDIFSFDDQTHDSIHISIE
ncbi:MAG: hypothetical protein E7263_01880 [Lachnospiraceae bacterium]|nr:hypothetical protein [Lachnospiraceae bacterium]